MILFLDTISPLPEFTLIKDNKIIFSKKIIEKFNDKMSDYVVPSYLELDNNFNLDRKLKKLITLTGPGSYTALRVGIAFLCGLAISKNIPIIGISGLDLIKLLVDPEELNSTALCLNSSNNQKFICYFSKLEKKYLFKKIEKNSLKNFLFDLGIKKLLYNKEIPDNEFLSTYEIQRKKIIFSKIIESKINDILLFKEQSIINPIYISNNEILG